MEDLVRSWKFWLAVIIAIVLAIVAIVLYVAVPAVKDIVIGFFIGVGLCLGAAGYILLRKKGALD